MKKLLTLFLGLHFIALAAQSTGNNDELVNTNTLRQFLKDKTDAPAIILKNDLLIRYNTLTSSGYPVQEKKIHKIIKVNTDRAIEEYNKVYIPLSQGVLKSITARTVDHLGKLTELDPTHVMQKDNLKGYGAYAMFALEGLEKGGVLEYAYSIEAPMSTVEREIIQRDIPIKETTIELVQDKFSRIDAKAYNGLSPFSITTIDSITSFKSTTYNIPALYDEKYDTYDANLMRADIKVKNINAKEEDLLNSWNTIANRMLMVYNNYEPSKKLEAFFEQMKVRGDSDQEKILSIEEYIKEKIAFTKGYEESLEDLDKIIENKYANEQGLMKLYTAAFNYFHIDHQYVVTSNKYKVAFDPSFSSYLNVDESMFYFQELDKFLIPSIEYLRLGTAPYQYADQYGLLFYVKDYEVVWDSLYINTSNYTQNTVASEIEINFNEDKTALVINKKQMKGGYRGIDYRVNYYYSQDKEEYTKRISTYGGIDDVELESFEVKNEDLHFNATPDSAMIVNAVMSVSSLLERAGEDYLIQLGMVIGMQSQLYQEHPRSNPIQMDHPILYKHSIKVNLPEGYKPEGLEEIKMDKFVKGENGERLLQFTSDYTLEENVLHVTIEEFYKKTKFDKQVYEQFREVINAAADFNKISILVEKG